MGYDFELTDSAKKDLEGLSVVDLKRILIKIEWFSKQPQPLSFAVRLKNLSIGDFRFRVGDYRIIAFFDSKGKKIIIAAIGHRSEVYR